MLDVSINHLKFAYDQKFILGGVDYQAKAGDFVCLLGQSGCGKSTLLRLIAGLEKSDPEQLLVGGKPVTGTSLDRAMVFQDYGLFPWMTAGENICIALKHAGIMAKRKSQTENYLFCNAQCRRGVAAGH